MHQTKDLFLIQPKFVDRRVDMVINQTINHFVEQISALKEDFRNEIQQLQKIMTERFSSLETRLGSIEQRLVAVEAAHKAKQDYAFTAGWLILIVAIFYALIHGNITIS